MCGIHIVILKGILSLRNASETDDPYAIKPFIVGQ